MNATTTGGAAVFAPRHFVRQLVGVLLLASLLAGGLVTAAGAQTCPVQPLLRDVTIGQGLPYSNGSASNSVLVSGKTALVRFHLSEQECADRDFLLNSASLIINGDSSNPIAPQQTLVPGAPISNHSSAPAIDSTGDPLFVVPPSRLSGTVSFRVDITFTPKGGSTLAASYSSLGGAEIQRTVYTATAPMRILAVPMGDGRYLFPDAKNNQVPQLSTTGIANATTGFTGLSRMFPVADGTGTLGVTEGGGVRYFLNEAGLVDINSSLTDSDGDLNKDATYCDGGFTTIVVPQLSDFRLSFNTAGNPEPAARVLGLLDEGLSNPSLSCSRGRAVMSGREAWVRTLTSRTGALMAMEEAHNFGAVPDSRDGTGGLHTHSTQDQADQYDASFVDRGYNLAGASRIASDRTALKYFETGWGDDNVLLEKLDWDMIFCKQGGPTTTNTDCSVAGSSGATPAVPAVTAIVGSTDFSVTGTDVFDSFVTGGFPTEDPDDASRLRLRELDANGTALSDRGVPVADLATLHAHDGNEVEHEAFSFGLAFPTHPDATGWQLVDAADGDVLASASKTAAPVIDSMTVTQDFPQGCIDCTDTSAMILRDESSFSGAGERLTFEERCCAVGDTVTKQYADRGVLFDNPDDGTPRIVGDCTADGPPCRAGYDTYSPTRSLWNNPQCDAGCPNSGPLTMRFPVPVQKLGMYVGGGENQTRGTGEFTVTEWTQATLNLYNSNDQLIGTTTTDAGEDVDAFIGFDAGEPAIAKATLDYSPPAVDNDDPSEVIDDLMFEGFASAGDATVDAEVSDPDGVEGLSVTWFAECGDLTVPVAVNQPVDPNESGTGTASHTFDSDNLCADGGQATILARVDDGYSTATQQTSIRSSADHPPEPVITAPGDGATILEHAAIKTEGSANDFEDGVVPGAQLSWEIAGPSGSLSGSGTNLNLPAPANGWTPGDYTATVTATDSDGNSQSTTTAFRIVTDEDNDGVPATSEACAGGSDADPFDNEVDGDSDGRPNRDDSAPCAPETRYDAAVDFDPDTLNLPSNGQTVKFDVRMRYRNVNNVVGATVKITKIDGVKVGDLTPMAGPPGGIPSISWEVRDGVGTAKFDRELLANLLTANGLYDKNVVLTLGGSGATLVGATSQTWEFEGFDTPKVMKKR